MDFREISHPATYTLTDGLCCAMLSLWDSSGVIRPFVEALKSEIAQLERQLETHPTYVRLREAKRLLAAYTDAVSTVVTATGNLHVRSSAQGVGEYSRPAASGASASIASTVRGALIHRAEPTPTREIMAILADRGVEVGGKNPQNVVSSLLSKSPEFISHGRAGWTVSSPQAHLTEKADDVSLAGAKSSASLEERPSQPLEFPAQGREAGPGGGA